MTGYLFCAFSLLVEKMGEEGVYVGEQWGINVTNNRGERWVYIGELPDNKDRVSDIADNFQKRLTPDWEPRPEYWADFWPVYGSDHYENTGGDKVNHSAVEPWINGRTEAEKEMLCREYEEFTR